MKQEQGIDIWKQPYQFTPYKPVESQTTKSQSFTNLKYKDYLKEAQVKRKKRKNLSSAELKKKSFDRKALKWQKELQNQDLKMTEKHSWVMQCAQMMEIEA